MNRIRTFLRNYSKGRAALLKVALALYITLGVFASVFPSGPKSDHFGVKLDALPWQMAQKFDLSDAGSYLKTALELQALNGITADKYWVLNLWPPGMPALEAMILHLRADQFGIIYCSLISTIWSFIFILFAYKLLSTRGAVSAFFGASAVLLMAPFKDWILGEGIFYAEGISMAAFFAALVSLIKSSSPEIQIRQAIAWGIYSGLFLAVASYFRSTFSTIEIALGVASLLTLCLRFMSSRVRVGAWTPAHLSRAFATTSASFATMFLLMEPWLDYGTLALRGTRAWSLVTGLFIRGTWQDRETSAGFLKAGGIGWACKLDPSYCEFIKSNELSSGEPFPINLLTEKMLTAALSKPLDYLADRFRFISVGWFSNDTSMGTISAASGLLGLAALIFVLWTTFQLARQGQPSLVLIPVFLFLLFLPSMIGHIEPRYFIPLKITILVIPWLLSKKINLAVQNIKERE